MTALIRLFYRAAYPQFSLGIGLLMLAVVPVLVRATDRVGREAELAGLATVVLMLLVIWPTSALLLPGWPLRLPAGRRRVFHAMTLGVLASIVPGVALGALGFWLSGVLLTSWIDLVQVCLGAGVVMLAMLVTLPGVWTWHAILGNGFYTVAAMITALCVLATFLVKPTSQPVMLIGEVAVGVALFLVGRAWFTRFDACQYGGGTQPRSTVVTVTVDEERADDGTTAEASDQVASGSASASAPTESPARTRLVEPARGARNGGLLPPGARLFVQTCWLRWGFLVCVIAAIALPAQFGTVAFSEAMGSPIAASLFWLLLVVMCGFQMVTWLRNKLDVLWPLSRGAVYEAFTLPLLGLLLVTTLLIGSAPEVDSEIVMFEVGGGQNWTYFANRTDREYTYSQPAEDKGVEQLRHEWNAQARVMAEQLAHRCANLYGVDWSAEQLLREGEHGLMVVTNAPLAGQLRSAARRQTIMGALLLTLGALAGVAVGMPGPWLRQRPRLMHWGQRVSLVVLYAGLIGMLLSMYIDWTPAGTGIEQGVPIIPLRPAASVQRFLVEHFVALAGACLVLLVVLQARNHCAFRRTEWAAFNTQGGWQRWRRG
jgi:hypothetical protein